MCSVTVNRNGTSLPQKWTGYFRFTGSDVPLSLWMYILSFVFGSPERNLIHLDVQYFKICGLMIQYKWNKDNRIKKNQGEYFDIQKLVSAFILTLGHNAINYIQVSCSSEWLVSMQCNRDNEDSLFKVQNDHWLYWSVITQCYTII